MVNSQNDQELVLQQVPMPPSMHVAIKSYAKSHDKTLFEIYADMVSWFFTVKEELGLSYLAKAGNHAKYHSLWIPRKILEQLKAQSSIDNIPVTRIIYTAAFYYMRDKKVEWIDE